MLTRITYGNDFSIKVPVVRAQYETSGQVWVDFDIVQCKDVRVSLICTKHQTVIPLEWRIEDGTNNVIIADIEGKWLHSGAIYGVEIVGLDTEDRAWRYYNNSVFSVINTTAGSYMNENLMEEPLVINAQVSLAVNTIMGPQGERGADGTVTFEDLTPEQKESLKGDQGPAGQQGDKGDKGDKGDTGIQGPQGERGSQGPAGNDGLMHAYDTAVNEHGFTGDIEDFEQYLATLPSIADTVETEVTVLNDQINNDATGLVHTKQDVLESGVNIKTINNESILGEGNITIESGVDVEPAKIVVTDEEVQDPDPDAVYIVQKPISLKTINGNEIVGTGNIEISGGEQSNWNETDTTSPAYIQNKPDITSIEGNISDIQNDIDNLEDDIAAQQAEISGVQTAISGHQTAIQNQATEISGMQSNISGMQTEISGMQTVIAGHQTAIQNQATEISGIQTNISGMQTEISGIQTTIAGHQTAIQNQATEISGMQTVLAGHQTAIQNQATEISGMQTVIAGHQTALEQQSGGGDPGFIKVTNGNNVGLVSSLATHYNSNIGNYATIEGDGNSSSSLIEASGNYSHAEGQSTKAQNTGTHAEGQGSIASGNYSHAEGQGSTASGNYSHAEGQGSTASGNYSHAEGRDSYAQGNASHAEGRDSTAQAYASHAEGLGTYAYNNSEHASGQYNVSTKTNTTFGDTGNTLFSVGNGTSNSARHNAFEIRQNGDIYLNDGSHPISSTTNGLKIEVVSALPSSPDSSTIYIVQ